ncbi:precorrin-3B C(17)-methyltransferase [Jannaschia seohaensis]|uniref:Cobalt-precorrin 5A hydrolase / precorrin-3B C17-methyltransferase n=1 Tax=Jannaschia seohaensis TaxID=475081 RepID=A0A2Y9A2X3_9RHOB|nr:precorrin-3B C(17)-methyltransferase [Jannaschia seohaensis]PWJ21968.1 cobalt-precorrin 5A hydrolase/precorrin-3B C17-methyltransferase [Jannaschia seohaensis]SSA38246.1 cobalt-precorrin 5A hydrolase / precorrin-3B C17-methyltransferase [Jannaschia seohaensis]
MALSPIVLTLNAAGEPTARRVAEALGCPLHGREGRTGAEITFPDALAHARDLFAAGHAVIGVCAAGILIRAVSPLLSDKTAEPPVLSVSDDGAVVVPLLGGHRGANRLARRIAEALGATAAVTTAGEVALGVALDEPPPGWALANPQDAKPVMATLLSGSGARTIGDVPFDLPPGDGVELVGTEVPAQGGPTRLVYHPMHHVVGVGCARDADPEELWENVQAVLSEAGVAPGAVAAVATVDLKLDEPAVHVVAERLGRPVRAFSPEALTAIDVPNPSEVVRAEIGTPSVAEAAALALAGGTLVHTKRKTAMTTAALARAEAPITELAGQTRGRLSIVSLGPGQAAWRAPEASRMVQEAEELVGYGLYIDLLGPLAAGKPRADFPLGGEEDRCRYALERAGEGRNVALICSGDAGIYAMGALVYELLARDPADPSALSPAARRVEVVATPGISALQGAAARIGAPLGHDFCAISLSDLLTPRDDILRRLRAAAEGDFVIAFYNPVSRRRRTLLAEARDILLAHRPADTPVLLATSLGRPQESLRLRRLDALEVDEVDMLTTVLVGSSQTRTVATPDGMRMFTPRGYARKMAGGDLA